MNTHYPSVFPERASPGPSGFNGNNSNSVLFPESLLDTSGNYKRIRSKKKKKTIKFYVCNAQTNNKKHTLLLSD
jgi:hypothetical protein